MCAHSLAVVSSTSTGGRWSAIVSPISLQSLHSSLPSITKLSHGKLVLFHKCSMSVPHPRQRVEPISSRAESDVTTIAFLMGPLSKKLKMQSSAFDKSKQQ